MFALITFILVGMKVLDSTIRQEKVAQMGSHKREGLIIFSFALNLLLTLNAILLNNQLLFGKPY